MNQFQNRKSTIIIMGILSIVIGILFIGFPGVIAESIGIITGAALLFFGIYSIVHYFMIKDKEARGPKFIVGMICVLLGLYSLINLGFVVSLIPVFFGFAIIVNGLTSIEMGFDAKKNGKTRWYIAALTGLAIVALGVLILFNPFATSLVLFMYVGVILIVSAIVNIVHLFMKGKEQ